MEAPPRRVVYVVIDGMNADAFEKVTASGRAPALAFLREQGWSSSECAAVFPTLTPAATAALVTGETPARHGVPGMCWYDRDAQRFVNYGQSARAAIVEGVSQVVEDVVANLNARHLSPQVSTIHEQLHELAVATASVNFMVFRGPFVHSVGGNWLGRLLFGGGLPPSISGPKEHYYADVVTGDSEACSKLLSTRGLEERIKVTDGWAACVTRELLEKNAADMIVFYLHENDHKSHQNGPQSQVDNLAEADDHIAGLLDLFPSWEEAVREVGFVVTADHSQSAVSSEEDHILRLEDVLGDFSQVRPNRGHERFIGEDLAIAGNGRSAFVYLDPTRRNELRSPVLTALAGVRGIDQVMWRDGEECVVESKRGSLRFRADPEEGVADERGIRWSFEGELEAVDGIVEDGIVRTPTYPLAMWRIDSALSLDRIGDVVVTTDLTFETKDLGGGDHRGGGSHGSLHAEDSTVPFLTTLRHPPPTPSTIDAAPHIVEHFRTLISG